MSADPRIAELEAELARERARADRRDIELARERARADRLDAENADLRLLLAALRSSTLWRLTEPLRRLGSRLVGLRRLVRAVRLRWAARRLRASGLFDAAWYRACHAEVTGNPVLHYLTEGAARGFDPGPGFSTTFYRRRYPDTAETNPLLHYVLVGRREGRSPAPGVVVDLPAAGEAPTIAFVSGDPGSASEIYRVLHPLGLLRRSGLTAEATPVDGLAEVAGRFARAKALVLFRAPWTPALDALIERARGNGAVIVYDVDDLVFDPDLGTVEQIDGLRHVEPQDRPAYRERLHLNRRALELADVCVLSTELLAERVRALGKPAVVLANGADWAMAAAASRALALPRPADGRVRVGYASGTLTHQKDFAQVAPALARLLDARPEVTLTLIGRVLIDEFPDLAAFGSRLELRPMVPHDRLLDEVVRLDINLAPLDWTNPFCAAKSELKYVHAALVGVPTVASPTPPFVTAITPGETGFLAQTAEDWFTALDALAGDGALRRRIGAAARADTERRYGAQSQQDATRALFDRLLSRAHLEKSA